MILLFIMRRISSPEQPVSGAVMAGAIGLVAGFGFAILEGAVPGAKDPINVLLRTVTAVPLHGACGFRVGSAAGMIREQPARAIFRFLSAVVIHGVYNFMIIIPGSLSTIAAVLIALSALATAVVAVRNGMKNDREPLT
jgi:RsiW-degrading membrane proteinase PrsW (M82 family)